MRKNLATFSETPKVFNTDNPVQAAEGGAARVTKTNASSF
jgi:hypothetical protein